MGTTPTLGREVARLLEQVARRPGMAYGVMALIAWLVLLWLGRHGSFFQDEWSFIDVAGLGTPGDWFRPHNEHWSTLPLLAYRSLVLTVGLRTYVPYLGLLLALHLVATTALFVLLRRLAGPWPAVATCGLFLFFGHAYQNLFWAFQIGFVGSAAAGLWALVVLHTEPRARFAAPLATLLLMAALMCSGMGIPFLAAATVLAGLRRWWRALAGCAAAWLVFVVWFVAIGRTGTAGAQVTGDALASLPRFVFLGVTGTIEALTSAPAVVAAAVAVGLMAVGVVAFRRGQLDPMTVTAGAGLISLFVIIGIGRFQFGDAQATRSRYLYESGALLVITAVALLGGYLRRPSTSSGQLPSRLRDIVVVVLAIALVAGVVDNVMFLRPGAAFFRSGAGELRAQLELMETYPNLSYRPPPLTRWWIPSPERLNRYIALYGSPAVDVLLRRGGLDPTKVERDRALWRLVGGVVAPAAEGPIPEATVAPVVVDLEDAAATVAGGCLVLTPPATGRPSRLHPRITIELPDGATVAVTSNLAGRGSIGLGRAAPVDAFNQMAVDWPAGSQRWVAVPSLGDDSVFQLQLALPRGTTEARVCRVLGEG